MKKKDKKSKTLLASNTFFYLKGKLITVKKYIYKKTNLSLFNLIIQIKLHENKNCPLICYSFTCILNVKKTSLHATMNLAPQCILSFIYFYIVKASFFYTHSSRRTSVVFMLIPNLKIYAQIG